MFIFMFFLNIFVFQVDKKFFISKYYNSKRCSNTKNLFMFFTQFFRYANANY